MARKVSSLDTFSSSYFELVLLAPETQSQYPEHMLTQRRLLMYARLYHVRPTNQDTCVLLLLSFVHMFIVRLVTSNHSSTGALTCGPLP
jgi:hypothetical protein